MPAGPTMARPGSKARTGISIPYLAHSSATALVIAVATSSIAIGLSAGV